MAGKDPMPQPRSVAPGAFASVAFVSLHTRQYFQGRRHAFRRISRATEILATVPIGVELIVAAQRRQAGTRGREAHLGNQKCRRRGSKNYGQRPETRHFTVHTGTLLVPRTDMLAFVTEHGRPLTFDAKHGAHPAGNAHADA